MPEFINDDNGQLVAPYDLVAAKDAIENILSDKSTFMKKSIGARKSMERIDIKLTSKREIELLRSLL